VRTDACYYRVVVTYFDANGNAFRLGKTTDLQWRISVYGLIRKGSSILLVRPAWATGFELPGGGLWKSETIEQGLIRECLEETGYSVRALNSKPFYVKSSRFYQAEGKFFNSICLFYEARLARRRRTAIANTDEIAELRWIDLASIGDAIGHRMHKEAFESWQEDPEKFTPKAA
jgi:8-oxo-dGTP pyrophosphatase MutT (NUDIX family)